MTACGSADDKCLVGTVDQIKRKFANQRAMNQAFAKPGKHQFVIVLDHLKPNYNIGKILRTAEIFGGRCIHMVGINFFNPYPSKGAFKYVPCRFFGSLQESLAELNREGYQVFIMDPLAEVDLSKSTIPSKSAFVIGHEYFGVNIRPEDLCDRVMRVKIPQFGKIQSLNAAVAGSLAMYEYLRQNS